MEMHRKCWKTLNFANSIWRFSSILKEFEAAQEIGAECGVLTGLREQQRRVKIELLTGEIQ